MDPLTWSIILIALGFAVVVLELFVPSAGILGVLAATLLIAGVVTAFFSSLLAGGLMLLVTAMGLPVLLAAMVKYWPYTPLGKRILIGKMDAEDVLPQTEAYTQYQELVGQLGMAKTKMLPSGIVVLNDRKYDAVSSGFPIDAGQSIKVTAVRGNRIFVEPYEGPLDSESSLPVRDQDVLAQSLEDLGIDDDPLG